jgi:2-polyprenyl-3-methyl-5-hydroxy-6-metoxy-1,4-benzoquinol methylase
MKALTDPAYWDEHWWGAPRPQRLRWLYRDQDFETVRLIRQGTTGGSARVVEVGGGGSRILPYLGQKSGTRVWGTDFSLPGCRLLRANLQLQGVRGEVICENLFQSSLPPETFDVVYSCGVIEHFEDLRAVVGAHARLVKPGGRLVLTVPNLEGVQGKIFRKLAPSLWEKHLVFGPHDLARTFRSLGLSDVRCGYLGAFFIHIGRDAQWTGVKTWPRWRQAVIHSSVRLARGMISLVSRLSPWRPHTRAFSPAFYATGIKPEHERPHA